MANGPKKNSSNNHEEQLKTTIGRKVQRKIRARKENRYTTWFGLGMFGLIGWSVAIPSLIGVAIGLWLDDKFDGQVSWTLTLMIIGVALGCLNAWYWIKEESQRE